MSANPNATNQEIENLLSSFDLLDCIDRHPLTLSGGQRQRLAICQAIMEKKKFLIFDEPTSGWDFPPYVPGDRKVEAIVTARLYSVCRYARL